MATRGSVRSALGPMPEMSRGRQILYTQRGTALIANTGSWHRSGGNKTADAEESFLERINKGDDGCWRWTGALSKDGYRRLYIPKADRDKYDNKSVYAAHRFAWEYYNGKKIPEDHVPDHLCGVRNCVNPEHLELVTHGENVSRGFRFKREGRLTCANGHAATPENYRNGNCVVCSREAARNHRARIVSDPEKAAEYRARHAERERERRAAKRANKPPKPAYEANLDEFMQRVSQEDAGCWKWVGSYAADRPTFYLGLVDGKPRSVQARRWIVEHETGSKLARNEMIVAKCGRLDCVNPEHMERTTRAALLNKK